jgi:hypothetical protein
MHKVLFLEHVPQAVDRIIRSQIPEGLEWVTLETDDDAELHEKIRTADFLLVATTPVTSSSSQCSQSVGAPGKKVLII